MKGNILSKVDMAIVAEKIVLFPIQGRPIEAKLLLVTFMATYYVFVCLYALN
jgi:hypothetical protein